MSAVVTLMKPIAVGRMLFFSDGRFARVTSVYRMVQQLAVQVGLFVAYMMLLTIETAVHLLKPGYETASSTTDVDTPGDSGGVIEIMGRTKE